MAETTSLEGLIQQAGGPIPMLRSQKYDRRDLGPEWNPPLLVPQVPAEFSQWEWEARSWRDSVAMLDQTHQLTSLMVEGPDAKKLVTYIAANKITATAPGRAFQLLSLSPEGYMLGDGIVFHLEEDKFAIMVPNAVEYAEFLVSSGDWDVTATYDGRSPVYGNGHANRRPDFRYQIQGPLAGGLIEKLNGGPLDDVKFFHMTYLDIAGVRVRGLRHGMAAQLGLEIWGPWDERDRVRDAIIEAGREFGLRLIGSGTYVIAGVESGWYAGIFGAIYGGEVNRPFREWMPSNRNPAIVRLSGSLASDRVEDYYRTPFDIGYGRFIDFDHEFIGRDALLKLKDHPPLQKVTLQWNREDAAALLAESLTPGGRNVRHMRFPAGNVGFDANYDEVRVNGEIIRGNAGYVAYTPNERAILQLALLDPAVQIGDEVVIRWGEAGGGYGDLAFPPNDMFDIRATVSPAPYSSVVKK